ncbi:DCC1-like thiol-disulfide oxidoreductase family protein [Flavobacteriales bacterium]|nr:DCC1-like thiol-disulfide oxidoreductase family protein [Flavobacteriales bacterium]
MEKDCPIILFDGVCNLCNSSVRRIIKKERNPIFKFASIQSDFGQNILIQYNKDPKKMDSIVLVKNKRIYEKSRAIFRIAFQLKMPYPCIYIFWLIPYFARDWVYDIIAANRYKWYGKSEECWIPTAELSDRFID